MATITYIDWKKMFIFISKNINIYLALGLNSAIMFSTDWKFHTCVIIIIN